MQDPIQVLLAFSYMAGAIAFINPCGIAMLPAYVAFYLGVTPDAGTRRLAPSLVLKALTLGLLATSGFMLIFGGAGLILAALGAWIIGYVPWIAAVLGAAVALLGVLLLLGKSFGPNIAFDASRLVRGSGYIYFPLFGIAYAIASLSCTIPVFLYVALQALSTGGILPALTVFISYAVGMGTSMTLFTLALVAVGGLISRYIYRILPYTMRIAGAVMVLAGGYILYWQIFVGGLLG